MAVSPVCGPVMRTIPFAAILNYVEAAIVLVTINYVHSRNSSM